MKGKVLPHSPEWTVTGGYDHIFQFNTAGSLKATCKIRYVDDQYVSPNENAQSLNPSYFIGDITLLYSPLNGKWSLSGYVNNVSNEVVKTGAFAGRFLTGVPRTYGVNFIVKY